jgi:hypothetical protein
MTNSRQKFLDDVAMVAAGATAIALNITPQVAVAIFPVSTDSAGFLCGLNLVTAPANVLEAAIALAEALQMPASEIEKAMEQINKLRSEQKKKQPTVQFL